MNVGNLPPGKECTIRITLITELTMDENNVSPRAKERNIAILITNT